MDLIRLTELDFHKYNMYILRVGQLATKHRLINLRIIGL
jgi:hypothetical protein